MNTASAWLTTAFSACFLIIPVEAQSKTTSHAPSPPASHLLTNPDCIKGLARQTATIARVTDGDTVVLRDQRRVRLIGINTAELNAPSKPLRRMAEIATDELASWLPKGEAVVLFIGEESHDRHGRTLAHVIRQSDGLAVAQQLMRMGLAVQSAVAPNVRCTEEFAKLEATAEAALHGLWKIRGLMSTEAHSLSTNNLGFKFVSGKVTSINRGKRFTEVYLDQKLRVLIRPAIARQVSLNKLFGKKIEVRGWLSRRKSQVFLWLQHPANLRELNN